MVRTRQHRLRDRQPQRLGGLEVDDQLEFGGLLDGQIRGFGSSENLVHVAGRTAVQIAKVRPIGHEASSLRKFPKEKHCRQPEREVHNASVLIKEHCPWYQHETVVFLARYCREHPVEFTGISRFETVQLHSQDSRGGFCILHHAA